MKAILAVLKIAVQSVLLCALIAVGVALSTALVWFMFAVALVTVQFLNDLI